MTKASRAYAEAQRLIAAAASSGATKLSFNGPETRAMTNIPEEIKTLTALTTLDLSSTKATDLTHIAALTALTTLELIDTEVTDLTPVAALTALAFLDLRSTLVTDLTPVAALTALTTLSLSGTKVTDLTPIAALTALTTLHLSYTKVTDLTPIAALTALTTLHLFGTKLTDLTPIAALTALTTLHLSGTGISDLTPIAALTALTRLDLTATGVSDLRPLLTLEKLASEPRVLKDGDQVHGGLTFTNTPACADPRIAEIAEIKDPATRAKTLFDYLQDWVPPGDAPEPDPLLSAILINGQLELAPDPPTEAEQRERLKRALHERLQEKAPDLARAAGNQFPRLAAKSRVIAELVAKPFAELDLLAVHLEVEDLADRATRGMEDGVPYSEEVASALGDVTRLGPGLTLGHPEVDLFILRLRDAREHPMPEAVAAIHAKFSQAIIDDARANGERSRAMEVRLQALDDPTARAVAVHAKQYGLLHLIGQRLALAPTVRGIVTAAVGGFAAKVAYDLFGAEVVAFLQLNGPLLLEVAKTYGQFFATWFANATHTLFQAASVTATLDQTTIRDRLK